MDQARESPPASYTEYLAKLAKGNTTFEWLHQFFKHRPERPDSKTIIVDVVENRFQRKTADLDTLMNRPATVQMRLILFQYIDIWTLDRVALDNICHALTLDPWMIWEHFDHEVSHFDNPFDDSEPSYRKGPLPRQIPSSSTHLNIRLLADETYLSLLAMFPSSQEQTSMQEVLVRSSFNTYLICSVVLFSQESESRYPRHFPFVSAPKNNHELDSRSDMLLSYEHCLNEIDSWADTPIFEAALKNSAEFAVPFINIFLRAATKDIEVGWYKAWIALHPSGQRFWKKELTSEEKIYFFALMPIKYLPRILSDLRRFTNIHQKGPSRMIDGVFLDLEAILQDATRLADMMKDRLARRAAMLSLEESRKSIKIADSLQTLTIFAFIFIPLNFATSIFGANVREFGSGSVPIWVLIVTAVCIAVVAFSLSWIWPRRKGKGAQFVREWKSWTRRRRRARGRNVGEARRGASVSGRDV